MQLDDLLHFLDKMGIDYHLPSYNSRSCLLFKHCNSCGNSKFKVALFEDRKSENRPFNGICYRCGAGITSYSYLVDSGCEVAQVRDLHNLGGVIDTHALLQKVSMIQVLGVPDIVEDIQEKTEITQGIYVPTLTDMREIPHHPAVQYAISRGANIELDFDRLKIDMDSNAIVFVVKKNGLTVGWEYRYITPRDGQAKSYASPDMKKSENLYSVDGSGDIVVVEGPFNAISARNFGFHGIALFGSNHSDYQRQLVRDIAKEQNKKIILCFDPDTAGYHGLMKWCDGKDTTIQVMYPDVGDLNDSWKSGKRFNIRTLDVNEILIGGKREPVSIFSKSNPLLRRL